MSTAKSCIPPHKVEAFFKNPFANLDAGTHRALEDPESSHRKRSRCAPAALAIGLYSFIAFYALGPASACGSPYSELMPTRIRSNV